MQTLVILRPTSSALANPAAFGPLQMAEEKVVWDLYTQDIIRSMRWSGDALKPNTIRVVFETETKNIEDAKKAIERLPMMVHGLLEGEYIPLSPWTPLAILFGKSEK